MNSRDRVVQSMSFAQPDRVAVDLGSHRSSGIQAIAYARLREYLGLPKRPPRICDIPQQLAIVDEDVLDRFGLDCILILAGDRPETRSGNLLLDDLFGAEIIWTTHADRDQTLQAVFDHAWEHGRRPYLVPYGGSSPTGAAAYAFAIQELMEQVRDIDWIVFASSSGGTQAGLVVGARIFGYVGQILGISVDEPQIVLQERVASLALATADFLGVNLRYSPSDIVVNADYTGLGYGILGDAEREAIRIFARQAGLLLDPVYTGRAAAGLIDLIRQDFFCQNDTILFLHTGGVPALFADRYQAQVVI